MSAEIRVTITPRPGQTKFGELAVGRIEVGAGTILEVSGDWNIVLHAVMAALQGMERVR